MFGNTGIKTDLNFFLMFFFLIMNIKKKIVWVEKRTRRKGSFLQVQLISCCMFSFLKKAPVAQK